MTGYGELAVLHGGGHADQRALTVMIAYPLSRKTFFGRNAL